MTKKTTKEALEWHLGLVAAPPSDYGAKLYLAQFLPDDYRLKGDKLVVVETGRPASKRTLVKDKNGARRQFDILRSRFGKHMKSNQKIADLRTHPKETSKETSVRAIVIDPSNGSTSESGNRLTEQSAVSVVADEECSEDQSLVTHFTAVATDRALPVYDQQIAFFARSDPHTPNASSDAITEAASTTPLFSGSVLDNSVTGSFDQYGLLCQSLAAEGSLEAHVSSQETNLGASDIDPRIFLNVNAPWSSFICGSQGSGKSHTLSCMLENCLIQSVLGGLPCPLLAIVFHYDSFSSFISKQLCEAAFLCSAGVPVRVLVSPSNYWRMKDLYEKIPISSPAGRRPQVIPTKFRNEHLDISRMMTLMAVSNKDGSSPLYIEVVRRILRDMAMESQGAPGLDYETFRERVNNEEFSRDQKGPLKLRLELLESFMDRGPKTSASPDSVAGVQAKQAWSFQPGTLTIVDLSCPFVDESSACALFSICLDLFLERRSKGGCVVALDEAHKFMTSTDAATSFTDKLLSVIRQQRHLATRVVISTQEPTISPRLLDLCTLTIVHRFTSPEWYQTLRKHLAGASDAATAAAAANDASITGGSGARKQDLFAEIVDLETGEALVFCPSATVGPAGENKKLGMGWLKVKVRRRLTEDRGRSILAVR